MIVRFSVSNFLSFEYNESDIPCIDMVASKPRNKINHIFNGNELLKSAVMFGGNGSGKSNITKGLRFLKRIVTTQWMPTPNSGYYCKNSPDNKTKPIRFKIEFIKYHDGKDLSDVMDWFINRKVGTPDDVCGLFKEGFVHYEYIIELQYISGDLPYNISVECCNAIVEKRRIEQFHYSNEIDPDNSTPAESEFDYLATLVTLEHVSEYMVDLMQHKKLQEIELKDVETKIIKANEQLDYYKHEFSLETRELVELSRLDAIQYQIAGLKEERNRLAHDISELADKEKGLQQDIAKTKAELINLKERARKKKFLNKIKTVSSVRDFLNESSSGYETPKEWMEACSKYDIMDWFANTLTIVDIRDKVLPIRGFEELNEINKILPNFDIHIKGLQPVDVTDTKELKDIVGNLDKNELKSFFEYARRNCGTGLPFTKVVSDGLNVIELKFRNSSLAVKKLMTLHNDGSIHELLEESDGTRRLIELATVLIQPRTNKVYVIDELDRRLHPLISKTFISHFYNLDSQRMQLIITTHETRLATLDIFRPDEIFLVDHDDNGTKVTRAKDALKVYNKPFEELFLEDHLLGGVPRVKTLQ